MEENIERKLPTNLIGMVAICNDGRIGIIKKKIKKNGKFTWEGVGYYDKKSWSSKNPYPIALTLEDFEEYKNTWSSFIKNTLNKENSNG